MGWLAGGLVLGASGWAAGQQATEIRTRETRTTTTTGVRRVSTLIGSPVRLQGGDQYGKIEDIVLNDAGCVEYVVISHDSDYILVPWTVTTVNYEERVIIVDTTPQKLAPLVFTRDNWPNPSDPQFTQRIQQVFGANALRREGRGGVNAPGPGDQGGGVVRPRSSDRTPRDDAPAPADRPRVRDVVPKASDRPAAEVPPRVREATPPKASDRPAAEVPPRVREATPPKAAGRPEPGDQPGGREGRPKATGRGSAPGERPSDPGAPKKPEEPPRSEPERP